MHLAGISNHCSYITSASTLVRRSSAIDKAEVQIKLRCRRLGDDARCCVSSEALLFTIYQLFSAIIDARFNKRSSINQCSLNIPKFTRKKLDCVRQHMTWTYR